MIISTTTARAAVVVSILALTACRSATGPAAASDAEVASRVIEGVSFAADASLMFLTPEQQRVAYRNLQHLAPTNIVARGSYVSPLVANAADLSRFTYQHEGRARTVDDFIERTNVAGLLVISNDAVVVERYAQGNSSEDVWTSFSVAKSVLSLLYGAALESGAIRSLDDEVVAYVPALKGSAYEGVSIRQLLQMSSGVAWNEEETDRASDLLQTAVLAQEGGIDAILAYMARLPRRAEPGSVFNYNTGETLIAGAVLRAATGKPLADYLAQTIWQPAGMEKDAYWLLLRPEDLEFAGCCISATLRDYGRLGQLMLREGRNAEGRALVPEQWVAMATEPSPVNPGYGFLWWLDRNGGYSASGSFGQIINVDPERTIVVVIQSLWAEPVDEALIKERRSFLAALSDHLSETD